MVNKMPDTKFRENCVVGITLDGDGGLEEAPGLGIEQSVEPEGGHLGVALVSGMGTVLDIVEGQAVVAVEVDEDDGVAGGLVVRNELLELLIDDEDVRLGVGIAVDEEGGQDDGGLGPELVQLVDHGLHAGARVVDVDGAHAVVGAGVDQVDVGAVRGARPLDLAAHLVDDVPRPPLVLVVLHGALRVAPHHVHVVAVLDDLVPQHLPVSVAVAR